MTLEVCVCNVTSLSFSDALDRRRKMLTFVFILSCIQAVHHRGFSSFTDCERWIMARTCFHLLVSERFFKCLCTPVSQDIVENSLSRTSWLIVFKETFFLTFRLMERTWEGDREGQRYNVEKPSKTWGLNAQLSWGVTVMKNNQQKKKKKIKEFSCDPHVWPLFWIWDPAPKQLASPLWFQS